MSDTLLQTSKGALRLEDLKAEAGQNSRKREIAHPDNACIRWEAARVLSTKATQGKEAK